MIPFVVGPRSPNGLQAQLQAEAELTKQLVEAPRALGTLVSINIGKGLKRSKEVKLIMAEDYTDVDDRVMDNYSLLLSMAEEVSDKCKLNILKKLYYINTKGGKFY